MSFFMSFFHFMSFTSVETPTPGLTLDRQGRQAAGGGVALQLLRRRLRLSAGGAIGC